MIKYVIGFCMISIRQYCILQCYENYNLSTKTAYPYFAGKADSDQASLRFSNIFGPVEARANWDIEDIIIELK